MPLSHFQLLFTVHSLCVLVNIATVASRSPINCPSQCWSWIVSYWADSSAEMLVRLSVYVCINPQNFDVFPVAFYSPICRQRQRLGRRRRRRRRWRLLCSCLYGLLAMLYVLLFYFLSPPLSASCVFFPTIFGNVVVELFVSLSRCLLLG